MKKGSFLFVIGIVAIVLMAAYTGYGFYEKSGIDSDLKAAKRALVDVQAEFLKYENGVTEEAIAAKKTLNELSDTVIEWSKIIKEIRRTIPVDKKGIAIVEVLSYSGSGLNEISMNVKTNTASEEPYFDAADLIQAFDDSKNFKDNFVPSVSKSKDVSGNEILTFLFNTKFSPESVADLVKEETAADSANSEEDLSDAISDVLSESLDETASEEVGPSPISR